MPKKVLPSKIKMAIMDALRKNKDPEIEKILLEIDKEVDHYVDGIGGLRTQMYEILSAM